MDAEYIRMVERDSKNIPEKDREHFIRFMTDEKYRLEKTIEYYEKRLNEPTTIGST
ncbi:hypothetical protein [Gracilibacillus massiliensis]|uniref:hypothetical protein n=1 Tax=Gracilibacillus massiliensis TaxID=1564956 RepID=UPI000ABC996E|nr:hypothetical protein [Gracilibacillus massiliensis]